MSSKLNFNKWSCKKRGKKKFINPFSSYISPYKRTWYQRDIDQIIYSTASRKMQRKSQLLPTSDPRCRTRASHIQEVVRIAREISEGLSLDTTLTEAIAYGHDLGNSPYGAVGNKELYKLSAPNKGDINFKHEEASKLMALTISAHKIETGREGDFGYAKAVSLLRNNDTLWEWPNTVFQLSIGKLNDRYYEYVITPEVLNGIEYHNHGLPATLEGQVVQVADKFAYIIQDIDDLIKIKLLKPNKYMSYQHAIKLTCDGNTMKWGEINDFCPSIKLNDIFHITRGRRVSTLISRFIKYNLDCLNEAKLNSYYSKIKQENIPKLKVDKGLKFLEKYIKKQIIKPLHKDAYIFSASKIQVAEIQTLFYIFNDSNLIKENKSLSEFMASLGSSPFEKFNKKEWKICYLIANLSCDEVKIIFDRYHQRDTKFELNLKEDIDVFNIL